MTGVGVLKVNDAIRASRLYEAIEQVLATEIVDGKYDERGLLPSERSLTERFEVGRPAIREAIFALARRGLVEQRQGRRVRVLKPNFRHVVSELDLVVRGVLRDSTNLVHLMEVRRLIETNLVAKVAEEISEAGLVEIRTALDRNEAALDDQEEFWRTDIAFHGAIAAASRNPIMPEMVSALLSWLIVGRRVTQPGRKRNELAFKHHLKIFKAIEGRLPDAARQAMADHLRDTETAVIKGLNLGSRST